MKRLLSFVLAICMIASLFVGIVPQTARAAGEIVITDAATLQEMLNSGSGSEFILSEGLHLETRGRFFCLVFQDNETN